MRRHVVLTQNPYDSIWQHLRLFAQPSNAKRLLDGTMKTERVSPVLEVEILHQKSSQLAYSISQASEYFSAAQSVSLTTSPVLYYYGMLSLAKAAIVANHPSFLLEDVKYHGLSSRPPNDDLSLYAQHPSRWSLDKEFVVVRSQGVYPALTQVVQGFQHTVGTTIILKALLSVDPEISHIYQRFYPEPPNVQYLYSCRVTESPFSIELCPRTVDKAAFETAFPQIPNDFDLQPGIRHEQALVYTSRPHLSQPPRYYGVYQTGPGGNYIVGSLPLSNVPPEEERYQYPELSDYLLMFILSNCVRYKQEFWGRLLHGETDGALGLVSMAIDNIRIRYPRSILTQLLNEEIHFGTGAYFT